MTEEQKNPVNIERIEKDDRPIKIAFWILTAIVFPLAIYWLQHN